MAAVSERSVAVLASMAYSTSPGVGLPSRALLAGSRAARMSSAGSPSGPADRDQRRRSTRAVALASPSKRLKSVVGDAGVVAMTCWYSGPAHEAFQATRAICRCLTMSTVTRSLARLSSPSSRNCPTQAHPSRTKSRSCNQLWLAVCTLPSPLLRRATRLASSQSSKARKSSRPMVGCSNGSVRARCEGKATITGSGSGGRSDRSTRARRSR